ncbi:MAG TPA: hypothetical protein VI731_07700 [Bacteroidia bacterium]|nr:hypothetical protein [Bacteroidia bacterium]
MSRFSSLVLSVLFTLKGIAACDCPTDSVTIKSLDRYDVIFQGKVVSVSGCDETAKVIFSVITLFKGKSYPETTLEFDCSSDCQMSFAPGEEWIIYAEYIRYGEGSVKFCSLSRKKPVAGEQDHFAQQQGMSYDSTIAFLKKNYGVQLLHEKKVRDQQHHELILPDRVQMLGYLAAGLVVIVLLYFIVKKVFKNDR